MMMPVIVLLLLLLLLLIVHGDDGVFGEVVEESAGRAIGCMHGTQIAPALRQQLPHCRQLQLLELLSPMNTPKVTQKAHLIQTIRQQTHTAHLVQTTTTTTTTTDELVLSQLIRTMRSTQH